MNSDRLDGSVANSKRLGRQQQEHRLRQAERLYEALHRLSEEGIQEIKDHRKGITVTVAATAADGLAGYLVWAKFHKSHSSLNTVQIFATPEGYIASPSGSEYDRDGTPLTRIDRVARVAEETAVDSQPST